MSETTQKGLTQADTDRICLELWAELENVPFDYEDDGRLILAKDFRIWPKGTSRGEIWLWFERHYSKGVASLVYGE